MTTRASTLPIVRRVEELRARLREFRSQGTRIGLVPTMGSLHAGHMALVARAVSENDRVVATLFVNPKQFDRADDLMRYPRTWRELARARALDTLELFRAWKADGRRVGRAHV